MSEKLDGGPAFTNQGDNTPTCKIYDGMSLRDYFAGQALTGWMASPDASGSYDDAAFQCYKYADAMIKARGE